MRSHICCFAEAMRRSSWLLLVSCCISSAQVTGTSDVYQHKMFSSVYTFNTPGFSNGDNRATSYQSVIFIFGNICSHAISAESFWLQYMWISIEHDVMNETYCFIKRLFKPQGARHLAVNTSIANSRLLIEVFYRDNQIRDSGSWVFLNFC